MARWEVFESAAPDLAARGHHLLHQYGLGLGFLATVRPDGGPRLHPFCPIVAEGGLWGFIGLSPGAISNATYVTRPSWPPTYRAWIAG